MSHSEAFLRKRKKHRRAALIVLVLFVIGLILLGLAGLVSAQAVQHGTRARDAVQNAQAAVADRDFALAGEELALASDELEAASLKLSVFRILRPVPWVGRQVSVTLELLEDGTEALEVVRTITEIGIDVESDLRSVGVTEGLADIGTFKDLSPEARRELVMALHRAVPDFEQAKARLDRQRVVLEGLSDRGLFFGLQIAREELLDQVRLLDDSLTLLIPVLQVLPDMGGFNGAQHYLVFMQNTGELRPTGGFWGTYGVIRIEDGEIADIVTDDIYAVDGPSEGFVTTTPPAALQRYLSADAWYLRDANWSPDIPTSVRRAFAFYNAETGVPATEERPVTAPRVAFDGAILITPEIGVQLLRSLGNVTIRDIEFTPETFFDALEYEVEQGFVDRGILVENRKDVIGDMVAILFDRLQTADTETMGELLDAGLGLLGENDIVLYSQDPDMQRIFEREGWAGDLRINAQHDHAMVVDANLAALKTDTEIQRAYTYSITKNVDGDLIANLQVNYDHLGGFDYRTTRYRTYTRVYVPLGSEFIRAEGALKDDILKNPGGLPGTVDVSQEFGATVFGAFTSIEPQASGRLSFVYRLPEYVKQMVEDGTYVFDFQRQVGVGDAALTLDLNFGEPITSAEPSELSEYWFDDRYTYSTRAVPHQSFVVQF